jgi:hypothetical protein
VNFHIRIVVADDTTFVELTARQVALALKRFPLLEREAMRWSSMRGAGTLLVVDPEMSKAVIEYVNGSQ